VPSLAYPAHRGREKHNAFHRGGEGVEPARTGFEEEEEHVTDDGRRHRATTAISTSPTLLFPVGGVRGPYLRQI
jgi:succinylarginine dihydrolase